MEEEEYDYDGDDFLDDGTFDEEDEMEKEKLDLRKFMLDHKGGVASVVVDRGRIVHTLANQGCHGSVPYSILVPDTIGLWTSARYFHSLRDLKPSQQKAYKRKANAWWAFITSATGPYRLQEGMSVVKHRGTPYAIHVPLHKGMNGQLLMNFLIATRIPFENRNFLTSWWYFQQYFTKAEAMFLASYIGMKGDGKVQWTGDLAHYPFSTMAAPIQAKFIIDGTPNLRKDRDITTGNHFPVNAIWTEDGKGSKTTAPFERPLVRLLSKDTPYQGVFIKYLNRTNQLKVPGIVNRREIVKVIKEKGLP